MSDDSYEMGIAEKPTKIAGLAVWKVAIGCAVIVGIGLAVGLGVGLSKDPEIEYVYVTTTAKTTPATVEPTTASTTEAPPEGGIWEKYRLPDNIIPSHYRLSLHPNMTTNDYTGTNAMTFEVKSEPAQYVLVHAHESLNITSVTLKTKAGDNIAIVKQFRYPANEFYVVQPESALAVGEYVLTMEFYNRLDKAIVGIYKATYVDADDGMEKGIVGSDMEPTDARRGYPCFDEPAMKIRYTTSIVHESQHTALSNMNVDETTERDDGLMDTLFKESVPMSTYLGCFVVSEFGYIERISKRGIPLRVYAPQFQIDKGQADYAMDVMAVMFDYFEDRFDMEYSLPKCDMISIPNFGTGAMENWGLITYRETNLLWDPIESSTANKQRVVAVVSHELVHQWFGNIVTMKWWDNIWLNEGFAAYLEYLGIQAAETEWQIMDHFVINDLQPVMRTDSSVGSHPIVVNVSTPSQISEVFDSISYSKGGSVLRMLQDYIGDDNFFGGINHYLKQRHFSNANEQDLWHDMQEYIDVNGTGGYNIKEFMDPFVLQMGLPVIHVEVPEEPETKPQAPITQDHFLADANADLDKLPVSDFNYEWNVHIKYYTSDDANKKSFYLNNSNSGGLEVGTEFNSSKWIKLNPHEFGYYRVDYGDPMWANIAKQLEEDFEVFPEMDRTNLIDDGFNLAPAEKIEYTTALNLTTYLNKEKSYFVWDAFASGSSYIRQMLQSTPIYPDFQKYYLSRVKPLADELGWNASEGTHEEKLNRVTALALALRYGDEEALANATKLFEDWQNGVPINPDIRQLVYRYGILEATEAEWEYMLERYKEETVATEKTNLLRGLAATEDVALINRLLNYSKDPTIIKEQDFFTCITYISYSVNGNQMAWTWSQLNWEYMVDRFGIENRNLGRLIPNIVYAFNTDLQYWEVDSFFKRYPEAGAGERNRANALLQINLNTAWMAKNQEPISSWLTDQLSSL